MKLMRSLKMRILVTLVLIGTFDSGYRMDAYSKMLSNDSSAYEVVMSEDENEELVKLINNGMIDIESLGPAQQLNNDDIADKQDVRINVIGLVEKNHITQVEENIKLVPDKIIENFEEEGWNFYITTNNLSKEYFNNNYEKVWGVTSFNEKVIKVANDTYGIETAVIHELGHYFDYMNQFPSSSYEFKRIYAEEIDKFRMDVGAEFLILNEKEFFAQTFYYSIKDPSRCTPQALSYITMLQNN